MKNTVAGEWFEFGRSQQLLRCEGVVTTCVIMMQVQVVLLLFYIKYNPLNAVKLCCETQNSRLAGSSAFLSFVDSDGLPLCSSFSSDA